MIRKITSFTILTMKNKSKEYGTIATLIRGGHSSKLSDWGKECISQRNNENSKG